jgi:hypothetical protein
MNPSPRISHRPAAHFLLAARVPESVEGCHTDGLDIQSWAAQGLVDVLFLDTRTINVDVVTAHRTTTLRCHSPRATTARHPRSPYPCGSL